MKKYIYLLIMALIAVSCQETDVLQNDSTDASSTLSAKITKTESRAVWYAEPLSWDGSDMAKSRTYAKPEGQGKEYYHQYWSVGDKISYFNNTFNSMYVSTKADEGTDEYTTYFEQVSMAPGEALNNTPYYYGVYPYKEDTKIATDGTVTFTFPEHQEYCVDSYANGANGMIARHQSEDQVLEFLNFCSYLQLQLTTPSDSIAGKDIDKIILKANNSEDLMSGVGTITFNADGFPEVTMDHENSINHIVLDCKNQTINLDSVVTKFWFVLPGNFTFTKGFSITVSFSDGTYFHKSTKASVSEINSEIKIERNHIKPLAELPLEVQDLLNSTIRYKYNTNTNPGNEKFIFNQNEYQFTDENGNVLTTHTTYNNETGEYIITFNGRLHNIYSNAFRDVYGQPDIDYIIVENSTAIVLEDDAFYKCTADSIIIKNDIERIGDQVFANSSTTKLIIEGDIHTIDYQAFRGTRYLKTVTIKGEVENIESMGFLGSSISNLYIDDRVTNIGPHAFDMCWYLETISLPKVEHIGASAFYECDAIETIDLHGVHKIGPDAFRGCDGLKFVCISRECKEIEEGAFIECPNLQNVYIYATEPPALVCKNQNDPYIFDSNTTIHIPQGSLEKYATDKNWLFYINRRQVIADITPEQIQEHFGENAHESHNE